MDTIEMDRMQAQIGELTVEMSRLRQEVAEKGSSNYKEEYTGTLDGLETIIEGIVANHYNESRTDFADDYISGNVSGMLIVDGTEMGQGDIPIPLWVNSSGKVWCAMVGNAGGSVSSWSSVVVEETVTPTTIKIWALANNTAQELTSMAALFPYTLTLYFHEIPEE